MLRAARDTMAALGMVPVRLEVDGSGARMLAVMPDSALRVRSTGPYGRDEPPPEAMELVRDIGLRWSSRSEQPDLTVGMAGPWPELSLSLPRSRVRVEYVVPEAAPPGWGPGSGRVDVEVDVEMALDAVARSLDAVGEELPVRVSLDHPTGPGHGGPTVVLDRRRCAPGQRATHNDALRATAYAGQPFDSPGGTAFRTRVGSVVLQDLDP